MKRNMKRIVCLLTAIVMTLALAACGAKKEETPAPEAEKEWTREGYFLADSGKMLSITWMDDIDEPGWYVGYAASEDWGGDSYGGTLKQENGPLHGVLDSFGEKEPLTVTVSEDGADMVLAIEGGETCRFTAMDLPDATIFVTINTEGEGGVDYAEGEQTPEIDPEYFFQSSQINLAEPATYTFLARPKAGNLFVKWTKNGEDFSTEPQITLLLDESADFIAVFEEDPDWQNPVMNFIGEYQCDRAHALVEAKDGDSAFITIEWGSSAWEMTRWLLCGRFDEATKTVSYTDGTKSNLVYDDSGEVKSDETEYSDSTGTITFNDDGSFTWHDSYREGEDMVFEWAPVTAEP